VSGEFEREERSELVDDWLLMAVLERVLLVLRSACGSMRVMLGILRCRA
jgi:hypothetical protein